MNGLHMASARAWSKKNSVTMTCWLQRKVLRQSQIILFATRFSPIFADASNKMRAPRPQKNSRSNNASVAYACPLGVSPSPQRLDIRTVHKGRPQSSHTLGVSPPAESTAQPHTSHMERPENRPRHALFSGCHAAPALANTLRHASPRVQLCDVKKQISSALFARPYPPAMSFGATDIYTSKPPLLHGGWPTALAPSVTNPLAWCAFTASPAYRQAAPQVTAHTTLAAQPLKTTAMRGYSSYCLHPVAMCPMRHPVVGFHNAATSPNVKKFLTVRNCRTLHNADTLFERWRCPWPIPHCKQNQAPKSGEPHVPKPVPADA